MSVFSHQNILKKWTRGVLEKIFRDSLPRPSVRTTDNKLSKKDARSLEEILSETH